MATIAGSMFMNGKDGGVAILAPPDRGTLPAFSGGWIREDGSVDPFLSFVDGGCAVNWSDELEELHEESSRTHFIDRLTRREMLDALGAIPPRSVLADLGCSTGYLLEDLRAAHYDAELIGIDLVGSGLRKAHVNVPDARLLQADLCDLPIGSGSIDGVVSANVLEHVPEDVQALREMRRVLRPGARAVVVVPAGEHLYDYYDRFLGHERRYRRGELAEKARLAGLNVVADCYIGTLVYPAFALVKRSNRRRFDRLQGRELEAKVANDIDNTRDSRLGRLACWLESTLAKRGIRGRVGVRNMVVVQRPECRR